ncbi:hypothetical protein VTN00DRAFT_2059 [Thermoascus crustaceus]|uniref:uncharacterized protein n=1 Tax=Thermoascus crustaceus TaxID=5088 RepID=UPI00374343F6
MGKCCYNSFYGEHSLAILLFEVIGNVRLHFIRQCAYGMSDVATTAPNTKQEHSSCALVSESSLMSST